MAVRATGETYSQGENLPAVVLVMTNSPIYRSWSPLGQWEGKEGGAGKRIPRSHMQRSPASKFHKSWKHGPWPSLTNPACGCSQRAFCGTWRLSRVMVSWERPHLSLLKSHTYPVPCETRLKTCFHWVKPESSSPSWLPILWHGQRTLWET